MRPATRPFRTAPLAVLAMFAALALAGCGDDDSGFVFVSNSTDLTTPEDIEQFFLAKDGDPFGGNLLAAPIPPGDEDYIGEFDEDWYDAEAWMELGDVVEWFDVFVGDEDDTIFDVV